MSRVFKRPMFRRGGNVGTGIMTNVVDRSMHAEQPFVGQDYEKMFMEKIIGAGGIPQGMDPLTSYLLAAGPQIARSTSWSDMLGNLEGPNKALIEQQNKKAEFLRNLKTGAAQFGLEKTAALDLQKQKDAAAMARTKYVTDADTTTLGDADKKARTEYWFDTYKDQNLARNRTQYDFEIQDKIVEKFGDNAAGLIESPKARDKLLKKGNVGKVYYDISDGKVKRVRDTAEGYVFEEINIDTYTEGKALGADTSKTTSKKKKTFNPEDMFAGTGSTDLDRRIKQRVREDKKSIQEGLAQQTGPFR